MSWSLESTGQLSYLYAGCTAVKSFDNSSNRGNLDSNSTPAYRKNAILTALVVISVYAFLFMPQHAFSDLVFTDYTNSTSTSENSSSNSTSNSGTGNTSNSTSSGTDNTSNNTSNENSNSTSNSGINNSGSGSTQDTNSTVYTNSTNSGSTTQSTNSTNQNSGSTNSTDSNTGQTNQTSTTNSTQTTNSTNTTSNSTNTQTNQTQSPPVESSSPIESPPVESSGSDSGGITILAPTTTTSSSSSESVISPSIVITGINDSSINATDTNSSDIYSPTVYTGAPILPSELSITDDQQYYAYGDVVTIKTALTGLSLQNIALVVVDPTGNDIVSRTVTTDENGTAQLQFKIPSNFATGLYTDIATVLVDGRNYTNSTTFNVIKTHGISIDSVQLTDQQGNPVSMIKKGQNNFVKVSVSSGESMPALLTMNLFDTNQSSIGTASIKSTINPGDSQMTLSFFIPPNAQVGTSDIFTDAYSDWPSNGGTPLTLESCLSATLQDPTTLPVSYQPPQPQACTEHPQNFTGTTLVANQNQLTNDQATVLLGVALQNDSMSFMSPTQAQLLALAYKNGTSSDTADKSISLVSLNLDALNSTITSNTTNSGQVTNFTTLLGPALQNDPMAQKILQEIQISKQQVANIIGNETAQTVNDELIQKQRVAAASQLKQDLTALQQANVASTPTVQYAQFLATVPDNRTQQVFQGEFDFMQQRVAAANAAMQNVLDGGGSWDQAIQAFDNYASVNHAQIVQINDNLNVAYGLADSNVQSCFDSNGDLTVVSGTNPCIANLENNSTSNGITIVSVQPTDQNGNPVSLFTRGQSGFVRVQLQSSYTTPTLVTINLFDSNLDTLGTSSAEYTLNPGTSEVVLPYYVPPQATTGLASIYADTLTDWPNKGGTSESHELSYFVGLS